jgi:hypothetical protein
MKDDFIIVLIFLVLGGVCFYGGYNHRDNLAVKENLERQNKEITNQINSLEKVNRVAESLIQLKNESQNEYDQRLEELENVKKDVSLSCRNSVNGMRVINQAIEVANKRRANAAVPATANKIKR